MVCHGTYWFSHLILIIRGTRRFPVQISSPRFMPFERQSTERRRTGELLPFTDTRQRGGPRGRGRGPVRRAACVHFAGRAAGRFACSV